MSDSISSYQDDLRAAEEERRNPPPNVRPMKLEYYIYSTWNARTSPSVPRKLGLLLRRVIGPFEEHERAFEFVRRVLMGGGIPRGYMDRARVEAFYGLMEPTVTPEEFEGGIPQFLSRLDNLTDEVAAQAAHDTSAGWAVLAPAREPGEGNGLSVLAGEFEEMADAQGKREELIASGYPREQVRIVPLVQLR